VALFTLAYALLVFLALEGVLHGGRFF